MHRAFSVLNLVLLTLVLASLAWGQGTDGTIAGRVTDPSGASIPGVAVLATNADTNQRTQVTTNADGDYQILNLAPGRYDLLVEASGGFKRLSRQGLTLHVADRLTVNLSLEVGTLNDSVTVTGEAPLLRTQDAQVGDIISSTMIASIPQINRNPLELLRLSGNISGNGKIQNNDQTWSDGSVVPSDTRINGGRTAGIEFLVDGQTIMTGKSHGVPVSSIPSMESVTEFKVISNGMAAEYGRASGGLVELVTKSGTNAIHGQAFEYFRNQLLNANAWDQNQLAQWRPGQKADRTQFHQNDFGFQVGGPVYLPKVYNGKNKTFFLFNYEGLKYRRAGVLKTGMAPTDAERTGDLTGLLTNGSGPMMWDPLGVILQTPDGPQKQTLLGGDGKHVPADRISPVAQSILSFVHPQNRTPTPGYSQQSAYMGATSHKSDQALWNVRLDQNIGDKHHLYFRFNRDIYTDVDTEWRSDLQPDYGNKRPGSITPTLAWDWTISPSLILNTRVSLMHHPNLHGPQFKTSLSDWQLDPVWKEMASNLPTYNFRIWSANDEGWGSSLGQEFGIFPSMDNFTNGAASASISKIAGRHTFKFGGETRRYYDNHFEDQAGMMNFQGGDLVRNNWGDPGIGDSVVAGSWGQFLLGRMDYGNKTSRYTLANAINYYAGFVQDDFRVNNRLTLNLGLRWDMETPLSERHDKIYAWDPNSPSWYRINDGWNWNDQLAQAGLTPAQISALPVPSWVSNGKFPNGSLAFAGTPQHPGRLMQKYHPWQFAPRLGLAYQAAPNTVIRASWGIMYLTKTGNYWDSWVAASDSASIPWLDRDANGNTGHPMENSFYHPGQVVRYERTTERINFTQNQGMSTEKRTPFEQNWSFGIQRQLRGGVLVEATYAGNHSGNLLTPYQLTPYPASLINPANSRLFRTPINNPVAGQIQGKDQYSYDQVPLGILFVSNPVFGGVAPDGFNRGRSNYNALNLRLEKRLSHGITFLANYTWSKSLDNVGATAGASDQTGLGWKTLQSWQTMDDIYGYSPLDETHRFSFFHLAQLPFGKGRHFLGAPAGIGSKILDRVVGGWEYAGTCILRSGRPLLFTPKTASVSTDSGIAKLWGSILGDMSAITPANFKNPEQALVGRNDDPTKMPVYRFDTSKFTAPQDMVAGNIPPVYPWIRHPGSISYDGSLMKSIALRREGQFIQFRIEAENLLNQRGLSPYNTTVGDPYFGLIEMKPGQTAQLPRNMQISARLVF